MLFCFLLILHTMDSGRSIHFFESNAPLKCYNNYKSLRYLILLFQSTPLLVMCTAYCVIWSKQKSPIVNQNHVAREARLAKTLFIITGASLLTWLPFQIINILKSFNVIYISPAKTQPYIPSRFYNSVILL